VCWDARNFGNTPGVSGNFRTGQSKKQNMNKNFFFLCGAHTCGKTSILSYLEEKRLIDFNGYEIGKQLFYERKFLTGEQGPDFEQEVTSLEICRDNNIFNNNFMVSAVETWHVGNLAYALVRNRQCVDTLIEQIKKTPFFNSAYGFWLQVSKENIIKRTQTFKSNSNWAADFYMKVNDEIKNAIRILKLENRVEIINANDDLNIVKQNIEKRIINHLI